MVNFLKLFYDYFLTIVKFDNNRLSFKTNVRATTKNTVYKYRQVKIKRGTSLLAAMHYTHD